MSYELTSGQVAAGLRSFGLSLSTSTIQRYAREGRIPCRPTPGGRYRFDMGEVVTVLTRPAAANGINRPVLTGGLGGGEPQVDSGAERLRRRVRGTASVTDFVDDAHVAGSAVREQVARSTRRSLALA